MTGRRITLLDLAPGGIANFDMFDADQHLMLQQGQPLPACAQLEQWLEAGLFADVDAHCAFDSTADAAPSVLRLLRRSNLQLECLLSELRNISNADVTLRAVAAQVMQAVELSPDIALATILLNQIPGTYPVRHCIEAALVSTLVARAMHKSTDQTLMIACAALTMNLGMLAQNARFQDLHAPLSREDAAIIRRHPHDGAELLQYAGVHDEEWLSCVMQHHEHDDGSGYPEGKQGSQITQNARLIGLADRYCARISARNYRHSISPDEALRTLFPDQIVDAELAQHFVEQLGMYPPGTLVRLHNGEIGVVSSRKGLQHGIRVQPLRAADGTRVEEQRWRDTEDAEYSILEALHEDQIGTRFSMEMVWGGQARL
jgi:hypothetical protein